MARLTLARGAGSSDEQVEVRTRTTAKIVLGVGSEKQHTA